MSGSNLIREVRPRGGHAGYRNALRNSSKDYSSGERTVVVTRNASQQGIAEYADHDGVDRPFFLQPGGRMSLNKSMNAIQRIEKRASRGNKGRILKQTSLKSALASRPITSSTKPSH